MSRRDPTTPATIKRPRRGFRQYQDIPLRLCAVAAVIFTALCVLYFPRHVDAPMSAMECAGLEEYYVKAYSKPDSSAQEEDSSRYVRIAAEAAESFNISGRVSEFVRTWRLENARVLDVGAGRGYLQDHVADYVGLDISPSAKRYFHKRFVHGSATHMPLGDDEFDAAWSIWVLEHVPNPEAALTEMRRVVKDGGLLYLYPAWNCTRWAAQGYSVRPYSDFEMAGKLTKALAPIETRLRNSAVMPVRFVRYLSQRFVGGPTRLRYTLLQPNYREYYVPDSDALNSLDRYEMLLWFTSRGDECLNCTSFLNGIEQHSEPLIIRIRKAAGRAGAAWRTPSVASARP